MSGPVYWWCRPHWTPILFSALGTELAWLCPYHGVHQTRVGPGKVSWNE